DVLIAIYAFSFQIYGDFSGYSSIARGISKWLGFELTINFRTPYLAVSPTDFWRRWHISLSTWLRDYLYIPLGGNRFGSLMTYRNLMITMLLGGMWHGANWTFIMWGFYQGTLLCVFRLLSINDDVTQNGLKGHAYWLMRVVIMFQFTCTGWLLFRADSFHTAWQMGSLLLTDFRMTPFGYSSLAILMFFCLLLFLFEWLLDGEQGLDRLLRMKWIVRAPAYGYLLFMLILFPAGQTYDFIYFQF
ncbi:MAG: MBOAT family O-acyltransferase, partial [Nitrososphaera sp.]